MFKTLLSAGPNYVNATLRCLFKFSLSLLGVFEGLRRAPLLSNNPDFSNDSEGLDIMRSGHHAIRHFHLAT